MPTIDNHLGRELKWIAIGSVLVGALSVIGLASDVFSLSQSVAGRWILGIIIGTTAIYLLWYLYARLLYKIYVIDRELTKIRSLIEGFVTTRNGQEVITTINHDQVYRTVATKRILPINSVPILSVQLKANTPETPKLEIIINMGYKQGIITGMRFGIFHREQMRHIIDATCTPVFGQSTFSFAVPPECTVSIGDISMDTIQVIPIIDNEISPVNKLLAELIYELDIIANKHQISSLPNNDEVGER